MVQYFPVITGSLTVTGSVNISGSIVATGGVTISGSIASASYSANAERLDNLDSTSFVFTSSYNTDSSSFSTRVTNTESTSSVLTTASASFAVVSQSYSSASGSLSTRVTTIESKYATTGSNIFTSNQTICGNLTTTGTITAQTINVQQVTSSIVYSSGSNIFGCQLSDTQQFTGSMFITGSNFRASVTNACFLGQVCSNTLATAGNAVIGGTITGTTIYGSTAICGGVICGGATTLTGALTGTSATFSSLVKISSDSGGSALRLVGRAAADASAIRFYANNDTTQNARIESNSSAFEINSISALPITFYTSDTLRLTIASTGAATFAGPTIINPAVSAGTSTYLQFNNSGSVIGYVGSAAAINGGAATSITLGVSSGAGLTISSTGAATFACSVTANGGYVYISSNSNSAAAPNIQFTDTYVSAGRNWAIVNGYDAYGTLSFKVSSAIGGAPLTGTSVLNLTQGGNVGIGTSSPTYKLQIVNSGALGISIITTGSDSGNPHIQMLNGSTDTTIAATSTGLEVTAYSSHALLLKTANTERMRITSGGNVGIGITPCSWKTNNPALQVQYTGIWHDGGNFASFSNNTYYDGTNWRYIKGDYAMLYSQVNSTHQWSVASSGTAGCTITFNEAMRITSGGLVGINTATPVAPLQVVCVPSSFYGIIETTGCSTGTVKHFRVHKPNCVEYGIGILDNNGFHISTASTFPTTNGFTISSTGNVGIGNSSPNSALDLSICDVSRIVHFYGSSGTDPYGIGKFGASGATTVFHGAAGATNRVSLGCYNGTTYTPNFEVLGNGVICMINIGSGAGTYALKWNSSSKNVTYDTSSERYKDNIRNSIYSLCHILQLNSRMFEYKDQGRTDIGLIAEEVYPIIPELVMLDENAQPNGVSYDRMVSVLIKGMQEQQCKIKTLESCLGIN